MSAVTRLAPILRRGREFARDLRPRVFRILAALGALLGLALAVPQILPTIEVTWSDPMNPRDPFSTPFEIRNVGILPIQEVQFACVLLDVRGMEGGTVRESLVEEGGPVRQLLPSESHTVYCEHPFPMPTSFKRVEIAIQISYKSWPWPWRKWRHLRFVAAQGLDKRIRWNSIGGGLTER